VPTGTPIAGLNARTETAADRLCVAIKTSASRLRPPVGTLAR
jgi:hypothetical protein